MVKKAKTIAKKPHNSRVKTGIPGLDELTEGGFVKGSSILLSGGCGTGKTLFGAQFLYNGAKLYNEPGVYLSLEQKPDELRKDMLGVGMDAGPLEKSGKLKIEYSNPLQFVEAGKVVEYSIDQVLKKAVRSVNAKRAVLDSLGAFELYYKHTYELRQKIYEITHVLKELGVTAILISEVPSSVSDYSRYMVEEFVTDAVISLDYLEFVTGGAIRSMFIRKMRRTNQDREVYSLHIDDAGVSVKPVEERFNRYVLARYRSNI